MNENKVVVKLGEYITIYRREMTLCIEKVGQIINNIEVQNCISSDY